MLLLAQSIITGAPPSEAAKPATSWQCNFNDAAGATFVLKGIFPEIPKGTDPNRLLPTTVDGNGPAPLVGRVSFSGYDSYPQSRFYQIVQYASDGGTYVVRLALQDGEKFGQAQITRYIPSPNNAPGKLLTVASGNCRATFYPIGYKVSGQ